MFLKVGILNESKNSPKRGVAGIVRSDPSLHCSSTIDPTIGSVEVNALGKMMYRYYVQIS